MKELLLATRNRDKVREIARILGDLPVRLRTPDEFPGVPEVEEDGETFEENAAKKALTVAMHSGLLSLADDTGLVVPSLGGEPGVRSSRYAGEGVSYEDNWRKLLARMAGLPDAERGACFICVAVLADPGGVVGSAEGRCEGTILREPRGEGGFGYDPVFLHAPSGKTFAELTIEEKNLVSHRAAAMRRIKGMLEARIAEALS
ncbi:MAG: RdgB/HAM1 family non-canonical purine NTP pyrophosphatase [Candidatus Eisenbacteria bacterium]